MLSADLNPHFNRSHVYGDLRQQERSALPVVVVERFFSRREIDPSSLPVFRRAPFFTVAFGRLSEFVLFATTFTNAESQFTAARWQPDRR